MSPGSPFDALAPSGWPTFALVLSRCLGLAAAAPAWSSTLVPVRVRVALGVTLAMLVAPLVRHPAAPDVTLAQPVALGAEMLIGVAIGLVAALLMHGATLGGEVISVQMGLSMSTVMDPTSEANVSQIAQLTSLLVMVLYLTVHGPLFLVRGLGDSLAVIPPGSSISLEGGGRLFLGQAGVVFGTAVRIAAPVMVALFLANVALAILTRAVPQISAFMVAFPLTVGLGLLVLGASLPFRGGLVAQLVGRLPSAIADAVQAFTPVAR